LAIRLLHKCLQGARGGKSGKGAGLFLTLFFLLFVVTPFVGPELLHAMARCSR
jgi:hypothetical protein